MISTRGKDGRVGMVRRRERDYSNRQMEWKILLPLPPVVFLKPATHQKRKTKHTNLSDTNRQTNELYSKSSLSFTNRPSFLKFLSCPPQDEIFFFVC